jgi:hypothetical protein
MKPRGEVIPESRPGTRQRGATLVVGLVLLAVVTLLGLAGADSAHVERLLAQNERFRENAASAASAGLEIAIRRIVSTADPAAVPLAVEDSMPDSSDRYSVTIRFAGFEPALPQSPTTHLAGAHFELTSTGFAARRSVDRQRLSVMSVVDGAGTALPCLPEVPTHCLGAGELVRGGWQRVAVE